MPPKDIHATIWFFLPCKLGMETPFHDAVPFGRTERQARLVQRLAFPPCTVPDVQRYGVGRVGRQPEQFLIFAMEDTAFRRTQRSAVSKGPAVIPGVTCRPLGRARLGGRRGPDPAINRHVHYAGKRVDSALYRIGVVSKIGWVRRNARRRDIAPCMKGLRGFLMRAL